MDTLTNTPMAGVETAAGRGSSGAADPVALHLHAYPAVTCGRAVVPLKLKRALALLAYLAVRRGAVGREVVATLLWPDAPEATARARLRRLVHEMHGVLGTVLVHGDSDTLALRDGVTSDWRETCEAVAALARRPGIDAARLAPLVHVHAGRLLDGFSIDAEEFTDWLHAERIAHAAALARALQTAAERALAQGDAALAEEAAAALLRLDRCAEPAHVARIEARALARDAAGVETAYFDCERLLREELGVRPSPAIAEAYRRALRALGGAEVAIDYAPTSHGSVAYASFGDGRETIVVLWGILTQLDIALEEPRLRAALGRLARTHRVVVLDLRGSGLSERIGVVPSADSATEDIEAVLDRLRIDRAWLFGASAGGTLALHFALRRPRRVAGLLLYGTSASGSWHADWPWAPKPADFDAWVARFTDPARCDDTLRLLAPSAAAEAGVRTWYARLLRGAATRIGAAAMMRAYQRLDVRGELHRLRLPVLVLQRRGDRIVPYAAGEQLGRAIPGAAFVPLPGDDHFPWHGDSPTLLRHVERFVACAALRIAPRAAAPPPPREHAIAA